MFKLRDFFISFLKLGFVAFGGPAMVAYIKELAVDRKKWLDEKKFQEGVAIAQAIPGATAMQVAAYVGLKTRGILGGLASYLGFGLPAFILMLCLSILYEKTRSTPTVISVFEGLQLIVISIVANATLSFAKPIAKSIREISIALLAFLLFFMKLNPFLIIIICFLIAQFTFKDLATLKDSKSSKTNLKGFLILSGIFFIMNLFLLIVDKKLFEMALTIIKIDLFAFGGAYASLPLMLHEFVYRLSWIDQKTFMDGLALGQITPGPIVITATFVGYLLKGFPGAVVATTSVFSPSFLLMVLTSEMSSKIRNSKIFVRAQKGLLSSFTGLLLFATINFISNVEWNLIKIVMTLLFFVALQRKISIVYVVICGVLLSLVIF